MKITRRRLAAALVAPAAARPQPQSGTPGEELAAARKRVRASVEALRKVPVAQDVEPDFSFKA
jgi:hypothetical protein